MKSKIIMIVAWAAVLVLAFAITAIADHGTVGHGAPQGYSYQLNIVGVQHAKDADMTGNQGRRIFVLLEGQTKINLVPGDNFQVLDANGTTGGQGRFDGEATFQLPQDVATEYEVWVRPLGKPGGEATITTCAEDPDSGEEICSTDNTVQLRTRGKNLFTNVATELLFLQIEGLDADDGGLGKCLDDAGLLRGNGTATVPLFHECLEGFFWDYNNNGLKLLQLRFFAISD